MRFLGLHRSPVEPLGEPGCDKAARLSGWPAAAAGLAAEGLDVAAIELDATQPISGAALSTGSTKNMDGWRDLIPQRAGAERGARHKAEAAPLVRDRGSMAFTSGSGVRAQEAAASYVANQALAAMAQTGGMRESVPNRTLSK
jgi:hypothetical protein